MHASELEIVHARSRNPDPAQREKDLYCQSSVEKVVSAAGIDVA
jgi:hypothetical protein